MDVRDLIVTKVAHAASSSHSRADADHSSAVGNVHAVQVVPMAVGAENVSVTAISVKVLDDALDHSTRQ